jgi:CheY-like chemotaxis protein
MPAMALVVDDSMLIRYTVCCFLEERGYAVESATNGAEALDLLAQIRPDLIVTDLQMPKMSGSDLITALKEKQEMAEVPIVIVTGRAFANVEKRANFVIYKDIDIESQLTKALDVIAGSDCTGSRSREVARLAELQSGLSREVHRGKVLG